MRLLMKYVDFVIVMLLKVFYLTCWYLYFLLIWDVEGQNISYVYIKMIFIVIVKIGIVAPRDFKFTL